MRLAVLSDIHGNLPALKAVLKQFELDPPDKVAVLGDSIGYYYNSNEVLDELMALVDIHILGNHEEWYLKILDGDADHELYRKKHGSSLQLATESLSQEQNDWLRGLPKSAELELSGKKLKFCHEAPGVKSGYLYPDSSEFALEDCVEKAYDALFFGHSHYQFSVSLSGSLLVNPGSVGQARDVGGLANWSILHLDTLLLEQKRVSYDTKNVMRDALTHDHKIEYLTSVLNRNN